MKEIEVKAILKDKDGVYQKLKNLGCVFDEPVFQDGTEFSQYEPNLTNYLKAPYFLRIRTQNGTHTFTCKSVPSEKYPLAKKEHETKIEDREQLENILKTIGFNPVLRIAKTRIIGHIGSYEVCLDDIENLGSFIEIEKMSDESSEIVTKELRDFMYSLGILSEDEVYEGYDILMFKKMGNL